MKKKWKIVTMVFGMLCVLQAGTMLSEAASSSNGSGFAFRISSTDVGYTYNVKAQKKLGKKYALVTESANSMGANAFTNYIIIASDGQQISDPINISVGYSGLMRYWSAKHTGDVYLRANAGNLVCGYTVGGVWDANHL